jgi:hypothetical protein
MRSLHLFIPLALLIGPQVVKQIDGAKKGSR